MTEQPQEKGWLARRILQAHERDELVGAIVYGKQRHGKSSFAFQEMYDIYGNWDDVLRYTIFRLDDLVRTIEEATEHPIPALLVDDAGVHLSKYQYWINNVKVLLLQSLMDTVGTGVHGLIFTAPTVQSVLKFLRDYDFFRVKIIKEDSEWRRRAIIHVKEEWMRTEPGRRVAYQSFDVRLPDRFYLRYREIRMGYLRDVVSMIKEWLQRHPHLEQLGAVFDAQVRGMMKAKEEPLGVPDNFTGEKVVEEIHDDEGEEDDEDNGEE